jgi:hypothetical protein
VIIDIIAFKNQRENVQIIDQWLKMWIKIRVMERLYAWFVAKMTFENIIDKKWTFYEKIFAVLYIKRQNDKRR